MSNGAATVRQARSANSCADSEQPTPIATVAQSTRGNITLGAVLCMAVLPGTMIVPVPILFGTQIAFCIRNP